MNHFFKLVIRIIAALSFILFTTIGFYLSLNIANPDEPFWVKYLIPFVIGTVFSVPFLLLPYLVEYILNMLNKELRSQGDPEVARALLNKGLKRNLIIFVIAIAITILMRLFR